jgi:hypothetical protein
MRIFEFILKIFIGLPPVVQGERLEINRRVNDLLPMDCKRKKL